VTTSTDISNQNEHLDQDADRKEGISSLNTDENAQQRTMEEHSESKGSNFSVVDWGTVISKTSFGMEMIVSDGGNAVHYGLEARLLFAQQLLHHLLALKAVEVFSMMISKDTDNRYIHIYIYIYIYI
jgi:ABC-type phosphonate transport system ATPase subunit